jgi:hypothetical protein
VNLKGLMGQCGTVEVNVVPLLMLIGAAVAGGNGPDVETIVDMLDVEGTDGVPGSVPAR